MCAWDSVCGQVSIGIVDRSQDADRHTVLNVVGFDADPSTIRSAFTAALLTQEEHTAGLDPWLGRPDPLAPFLGDYGVEHDLDGAA